MSIAPTAAAPNREHECAWPGASLDNRCGLCDVGRRVERRDSSFASALRAAMGPIIVGLALHCGACSDCTREDQVVAYNEGNTADGLYESTPWDGIWAHFPAGRSYVFPHGLGTARIVIQVYLSFSENPARSSEGVAENAGNLALITRVDAESFQIRNDTCAEHYVRAVAFLPRAGP